MWEADLPDPDDLLRQGDLLHQVPFTILKKEPPARDPDQSSAPVVFKSMPAVVVSQCCNVQQRGVAELAAVVTTKLMDESHSMVRGLLSRWPAEPGRVFYDGLLLEPVGTVVPDDRANGRWWHVTFKIRVTYTGQFAWLQQKRVARMTPRSRRDLRLKLGAWYSRTEESDFKRLTTAGEMTGFESLNAPMLPQPQE